jgi:hypothetical protein
LRNLTDITRNVTLLANEVNTTVTILDKVLNAYNATANQVPHQDELKVRLKVM